MSSLLCPCLLVLVRYNNWHRFGQNHTAIKHHYVHWSNSLGPNHIQLTGWHGILWQVLVWRLHSYDVCWDVTDHHDTGILTLHWWHTRHVMLCHNVTRVASLTTRGRRRKCWDLNIIWPDQRRSELEDWLRMNCLLFERCKCLYGVWCGKELRRDEGLEPMTEVWVWGSGMLIRGCKPQMRWRTMFIPWCQHPRQGARRSPASCSEAAVRCCRGNPGSAVSRSAVSHGTTARTADTITGSVSLKPCSGMK